MQNSIPLENTETIITTDGIKYFLTNIRLGGGTFGNVYLGKRKDNHAKVAIKVIRVLDNDMIKLKSQSEIENYINKRHKLIKSELEILKTLSYSSKCNKYVTCMYGYSVSNDKNTYYIVMEYMAGGTLENARPSSYLHIFKTLVEGLQYIHSKGIIHQDIKPWNILLDDDQNPKFADFGIGCSSTILSDIRYCSAIGGGSGTPKYMDPEFTTLNLLKLKRIPDEKSDIFSLGATFFTGITGNMIDFDSKTHSGLMIEFRKAIQLLRTRGQFIPKIYIDLTIHMIQPYSKDRPTVKQILDVLDQNLNLEFTREQEEQLDNYISNLDYSEQQTVNDDSNRGETEVLSYDENERISGAIKRELELSDEDDNEYIEPSKKRLRNR